MTVNLQFGTSYCHNERKCIDCQEVLSFLDEEPVEPILRDDDIVTKSLPRPDYSYRKSTVGDCSNVVVKLL